MLLLLHIYFNYYNSIADISKQKEMNIGRMVKFQFDIEEQYAQIKVDLYRFEKSYALQSFDCYKSRIVFRNFNRVVGKFDQLI